MGTTPNGQPGLLRALGPWTAVAVVVGSVIGSGIFKKPHAIAQQVPTFEGAAAVWVLGGVLTLLGALVMAELGAMLPRAGGNYVYLREGYGPLWGFLWGWVDLWILRTGSIAALATITSERGGEIAAAVLGLSPGENALGPVGLRALTIAVIVLLTLVNAAGVRWGGRVQDVTTWLKVGSLLAIAVLPFALGMAQFELLREPGPPPKGDPVPSFGLAVLAVLWAYHGWMNLGPLGEELHDPQKNVPRALLGGVGIVIVVYLAANLAYALVLSQTTMATLRDDEAVAVRFAQEVFRGWGARAMTWAGVAIAAAMGVSALGALNANVLIGARTVFALGRDRLFPDVLGRVHATYRTPVPALVLQAAWTVALVLGAEWIRESPDESPFDTLTNFVMFGAIIFETMTVASIYRFRRLHPDWPRPYRCLGYPVVPAVYVLILVAILANTVYKQPIKSAAGLGFIGVGVAVFFLWAERRGHAAADAGPGLPGPGAPEQ